MKTLIFTDLDGTFLNHHNYSFDESKQALEKVEHKKIPLIFTTSKTRVEVEVLQKKVAIKEPFIVENGAAIFIPKNYQNLDFSFLDVSSAINFVQREFNTTEEKLKIKLEKELKNVKKMIKDIKPFSFSNGQLISFRIWARDFVFQ